MEPVTNRSYRLRGVRITPSQQAARDNLWAIYGVATAESQIELDSLFNKKQPIIMEIGYGMGEATWQIAKANPGNNYLGVEVHMPGAGKLMANLAQHEITNVRLIERDVFEVFHYVVKDESLDGVHLFFPDPWPKKRHHRRRLITAAFAEALATRVAPGGFWHLATDCPDYASAMEDAIMHVRLWAGGVIARPESRPRTRYERRGLAAGREPIDLWFERVTP